jgi:hypothetical protein
VWGEYDEIECPGGGGGSTVVSSNILYIVERGGIFSYKYADMLVCLLS